MSTPSRYRPSLAMMIALVALALALVSTSYAAVVLPKHSVGTAQLKNRAVTKAKISKSTIAALSGSQGPAGPAGPAGSDASLADVVAGGVLTGHYPSPQLAAPEAPRPITFENGWHDYGLAYNPARFYKDPLGIVHLSGGMTGGTLHMTAFTLPEGYRPVGVALFPVLSTDGAGGSGNIVPACFFIYRNGTAYVQNGGSNAFVSLEGITFRAAY